MATAADIQFPAATVLTSISEMDNATRPGPCRLSFSRVDRGTTATTTMIAALGVAIIAITESAGADQAVCAIYDKQFGKPTRAEIPKLHRTFGRRHRLIDVGDFSAQCLTDAAKR